MGCRCLGVVVILLGVSCSVCLRAQEWERWLLIEEQMIEELEGVAEMNNLAEHMQNLIERPIKINSCSRGELKEMALLTDFQIESILDYRQKSGDILNASQLALLHGFDEKMVSVLKPFISFIGSGRVLNNSLYDTLSASSIFKRSDSQLWLRTVIKDVDFKGHNESVLVKYKSVYENKLQIGFTLENDAGERFFARGAPPVDFISFHAAARSMGKVNMLVIGDYTVRFGQGLSIWNSFSLRGVSTPMAFHKKGSTITPYTSSDESNFCRGAAVSLSFGRFDFNAFLSRNRLDATVKGSEYTSIANDGLHNSIGSIGRRKALRETIGGVNISCMSDNLKLGASFVTYGYNRDNGIAVKEYNKYQMYNGIWGNLAIDFYTIIKGVKLFGEAAVDYGGSTAALLGTVFNASDKLELGILLRNYSKSYIAPHAGAYSTISSVSNQRGFAFNGVYSVFQRWRVSFNLEGCCYPWKRFNINRSSSMIKGHVTWEYLGSRIDAAVKLADSYTSHNRLNRFGARVQSAMHITDRFKTDIHANCIVAADPNAKNSSAGVIVQPLFFGWQAGVGLKYKAHDERWAAQIGGNIFSIPEWICRIYVYEPDLPYTFGSRLLYGNGCNLYAVLKARLFRNAELYLKWQTMQYVDKNRLPDSDLKFAAKIKF